MRYSSDTSLAGYAPSAYMHAEGSDVLRAMGEPPLLGAVVRNSVTVMRFFWARSFHPDVSIRMVVDAAQCTVFTTTMTHARAIFGRPDSTGLSEQIGTASGEVTRRDSVVRTPGECTALLAVTDRAGLWQADSRWTGGLDGSMWRFERVDTAGYTMAQWWSPTATEGTAFWESGLAMLRLGMAVPVEATEIY